MRFQKAKKVFALLSVFLCLSLLLSVTAFAYDYPYFSVSGNGTPYEVTSGNNTYTVFPFEDSLTIVLDEPVTGTFYFYIQNGVTYSAYREDGTPVGTNNFNGNVNGTVISRSYGSSSAVKRIVVTPYQSLEAPNVFGIVLPFGEEPETDPPVTTPLDPLFENVGSASTSLFGVMGQVVQFVAANWVMLIPLLAWLAVLAFKSARKTYKG